LYAVGLATRDSIILEFSPTIISLILAGKVGSSIASEIGTMRVTEQIDALEIMGINSSSYLVLPKIIAAVLINPFLIILSMFLGIAGIYGSLQLHAALFTQLVLYIGGVMVLIGFALQLYPEPENTPRLSQVRESLGKVLVLIPLLLICLVKAPWEAVLKWELLQNPENLPPADQSMKSVGRSLLLNFPVEFEWMGVLMLTGLFVAGWFLKDSINTEKK
jgi:NADH:ubiquinone oxidoreductase subunit 6 (subunit J)